MVIPNETNEKHTKHDVEQLTAHGKRRYLPLNLCSKGLGFLVDYRR